MLDDCVGFIGVGNMGNALIAGVIRAGVVNAKNIYIYDAVREKSEEVGHRYGVIVSEGIHDVSSRADILILAVKPQNMAEVLREVANALKDGHMASDRYPLIISIAAGISIEYFERYFPEDTPIIRVMSNTAALVLEGASALARNSKVDKSMMEKALQMFRAVGFACEVEEKLMDAVTGLSGSGPAYVLMFLEVLTDAGVLMGLPRPLARELVLQTVVGTVKLTRETGKHFGELRDMVTSPGGTTIYGLNELEAGGFRASILRAVWAATKRSEELA